MATLETFKGTTAQVDAALATFIGDNTVVTITDDAYDLTGLLAIIAKVGQNKVILEKAASTPIEGSAENLKTMLDGVSSYTGDLKVTDLTVSAAVLNTIAKGTTGKVTAILADDTELTKATVDALADVKATDVITFVAAADTADASALIAIKKIIPLATFAAVDTITANAADVALVKEALAIKPNSAVTIVDDAISAADLNAIAKATNGVVTATITDGTVKNTLAALANVDKAVDEITFTTTDTSVDAKDLVELAGKFKTPTNLDVSSVTTITSSAANVGASSSANVVGALAIAKDAAVVITGEISAANASLIADATEGVLTATIAKGEAGALATALEDTNTSDILSLTVTDGVAADIVALLEKTGGKIKVDAKTVEGTIEKLTSIYITNKDKFTNLGDESITIDTASEVSAEQLNAIAAATTGKVKAELAADTELTQATVDALGALDSKDIITFDSDVTALDSKEALSSLIAIKKIIKNADFTKVATIEADAADVALVKEVLKYATNPAITVTIDDAISAADLNAIAKLAGGAVTATITDGTVKSALAALINVDKAVDDITFTTTDTSANAKDLIALAGKFKTPTNLDLTSIKTITGDAKDAADIAVVVEKTDNAAVTITGNVAVADIKAILDATEGKVTATLAAGIATDLVDALANDEVNAINVTVNGATATASNLITIKDATSGKITVTAKEVTGSFDDLNEIYVTSKGKFTALGDENVTILGTVSAADANIIAKAVNGVVTAATVEAAEASELISQLKDAKATDVLTLEVTGDSVKASELNVLDGKTSGDVKVGADVVISGNIADLTKVFASKGIIVAGNDVTILGTVTAAQANAIATKTGGSVEATIAAGTAAVLLKALKDSDENAYNLTVNGAKASATELLALEAKTSGKITVTAKEISGTLEKIEELLGKEDDITGLDKVAINITDIIDLDVVDSDDLIAILEATSGVVTAKVKGTAADLIEVLEEAKTTDKLTLTVTDLDPTAADLLTLDAKVSATIDAQAATKIDGSAADVKKLLASKGVSLAKNVAIEIVQDTEVSAADLNAIAKATTGVVTATVAAGTAAALNKALGNATKDDKITLEVIGKTATAADLLALDGKTSEAVVAKAVESITGTVADLKKVFVAARPADPADADIVLSEEVAVSVSGTVKADTNLQAVLDGTDGVVTATVVAGKAATLFTALASADENDALKLTITDTKVAAVDLVNLDGKTSVAVNAASVKTITGTAENVKAAYEANADKGISGLGNEAVDLTDANAELVSAINGFTTGVITLESIKTTVGEDFSLSQLGDLKGITGLTEIDADNGEADFINISIKDLLAANDSKKDFEFTIKRDVNDTVEFSDISGWTKETISAGEYTFTNDKTDQVITIELVLVP